MAKIHVQTDETLSNLDSGSEADVESEDVSDRDSDENIGSDGENEGKKSGMADAMARILGKTLPSNKKVILAKGMTDRQIEKKRKLKEGKGLDESDEKKIHIDIVTRQAQKKEWANKGRVKPEPLDRPHEKSLQRIATRGIVQLFNAVRKQQKMLDEQITGAGKSEMKKDKIIQSMTKDKFLNILKGTSCKPDENSQENTASQTKSTKCKNSSKVEEEDEDEEENTKWGILRDDFMMGATMKDWDKEESDEDEDDY